MGISDDLGQHEFFRSSTYENNPDYNPEFDTTKYSREPSIPRAKGDPEAAKETQEQSHREFKAVDYAEYKAKCEGMKVTITERPDSFFDMKDKEEARQERKMRLAEGLWRMATVYPYHDMNWLVTIVFAAGSMSFLLNAIFFIQPVIAPNSVFVGEVTIATPTTLTLGSACFLIGGYMQLLARFNGFGLRKPTDNEIGNEEKMETTKSEGYSVAMLGSKEWMWYPTSSEYRVMWSSPYFKADLIQFVGGHIFTMAAVAGFPGVINIPDPANLFLVQATIFFPQVVGGTFFLIAALIFLLMTQRRWYIPNVSSLDWQAAFWNSIGAIGFIFAGAFFLIIPTIPIASTLSALIGSWAFLVGGLIQWFVLMKEYPKVL